LEIEDEFESNYNGFLEKSKRTELFYSRSADGSSARRLSEAKNGGCAASSDNLNEKLAFTVLASRECADEPSALQHLQIYSVRLLISSF